VSQAYKPQVLILKSSCSLVGFFKLQAAARNLRTTDIGSGIRIYVTKNGENENKK
jgi:hypothetical protein